MCQCWRKTRYTTTQRRRVGDWVEPGANATSPAQASARRVCRAICGAGALARVYAKFMNFKAGEGAGSTQKIIRLPP